MSSKGAKWPNVRGTLHGQVAELNEAQFECFTTVTVGEQQQGSLECSTA